MFSPLSNLSDDDIDIDSIITTYNTTVSDTANGPVEKERRRKKPTVTGHNSVSECIIIPLPLESSTNQMLIVYLNLWLYVKRFRYSRNAKFNNGA